MSRRKGKEIGAMIEEVENDDSVYLSVRNAVLSIMEDVDEKQGEVVDVPSDFDGDMDDFFRTASCCSSCFMVIWS